MRTKKTLKELKARASKLRLYGYKVAKTPRTKKQRAVVSRAWSKVKRFVEPGRQSERHNFKFRFVKTPTKAKRDAAEGIHPTARTPKGVFVRVPKNAKSFRIRFEADAIRIDATGPRGGKRTERVAKLDPRKLVRDAQGEIRSVTAKLRGNRKWISAKLVVNGYDAATIRSAKGEPGGWDSPSGWYDYLSAFYANAVDGVKNGANFHGNPGALTAAQFAKIFHVKVITQDESTQKTKRKRRTRKTRRN